MQSGNKPLSESVATRIHDPIWYEKEINSLAPGRSECDSKNVIFNLVLLIGIFKSYDNALWWMPQDLTDDQSTLVQVMAWCRQSTSHYLSQCWPRSPSPYSVTRPQWVDLQCCNQSQHSPNFTVLQVPLGNVLPLGHNELNLNWICQKDIKKMFNALQTELLAAWMHNQSRMMRFQAVFFIIIQCFMVHCMYKMYNVCLVTPWC